MGRKQATNWPRLILGFTCGATLVWTTAWAQQPAPSPTPDKDASVEDARTSQDGEVEAGASQEAKDKDSAPQEEKKAPRKLDFSRPLPAHGSGAQDPQQRIRELFGEVETHLRDVDRLLSDAAAGDTSRLSEATEAGIGKLLQNSLDRGREAQAKIAEIMKLAEQQGASQSGGGQSQQQGQGDSSSENDSQSSGQSQGQQRQSREQTPEMGDEQQQGQEEGDSSEGQKPGEQPGDQPHQEQPGGAQPKDSGGDDSAGENKRGDGPDEGAAEKARRAAQAKDGWGDLPTHVQDTFRSQGRSELPVRYRDWIDEYYRKLNRQGDR